MPLRYQRLVLIAISMVFILLATILVLFNVKNNVVFFFTPTEIIEQNIKKKEKVRIGGIVKENSLVFNQENNKINFFITDNKNQIYVYYSGILPDLFKEKQGVVAEGRLNFGELYAKKVFAKHDENYMPASIVDQLKKTNRWNNKY